MDSKQQQKPQQRQIIRELLVTVDDDAAAAAHGGMLLRQAARRKLTNVPWERRAHSRHPCTTTHSYARNLTLDFIFNHLGVF